MSDRIPNPEFPFWKIHPVGAAVTFVTKIYDTESEPGEQTPKRELVNTKIVKSTILAADEQGVKTRRVTILPATPHREEVVIEEDFTHAATWDVKYKVEYKDLGVEKVTISSGTFECIKLQRIEKTQYAETVVTKWWCKDVPGGLVKLTTENDFSEGIGEVSEFKVPE